jgi:exodeoxyribonuclease-3
MGATVGPEVQDMKIITWNVNGMRAVLQKGLHDFWRSEAPDFFCLQETKCHPDQFENDDLVLPGWTGFWSSARRAGYSGTATFCKQVPAEVHHGFGIGKFDTEGRMVVTKTSDFWLFNVYFPNGGSSPERHAYKQEFLHRFGAYLHRLVQRGEKVIVVGDYNVAYLDADVYDPKGLAQESGFRPEERAWMANFLEGGFIDCYRYFYPDESERYTWWAYYENARVSNRGWRIDHICVSRNLESRLKSVAILDQQQGSDHCPVRLELS